MLESGGGVVVGGLAMLESGTEAKLVTLLSNKFIAFRDQNVIALFKVVFTLRGVKHLEGKAHRSRGAHSPEGCPVPL
jgi:hypothetical protein